MEEFLNIITYFPGECIAIVIGVIGSIIASVDKGIHNKTIKYGLPTY